MDARVTLPTPVIQILVAMPFSPVFNDGDSILGGPLVRGQKARHWQLRPVLSRAASLKIASLPRNVLLSVPYVSQCIGSGT
jgi:hypothetical protein